MKKTMPVLARFSKAGFIFFIFTSFSQSFTKCNNCNKMTFSTKPMLGFQKTKPKTHVNTLSNIRPPLNNIKAKPKIKPQPKINKEIIKATTAFTSSDQGLLTTSTTSGQTFVIGTTTANSNAQDFAIASYNNSGQLNNTFGTKGIATTDFLSVLTAGTSAPVSGSVDIPVAYGIQTNGSLIVAGNSNANATFESNFSTTSFALARYTNNGRLDPSFGTNGIVLTDIAQVLIPDSGGGSSDKIVAMSLLSSNKIIVAGNSNLYRNASTFAIARYNNNGELDTSFGSFGGIRLPNVAFILNPSTSTPSIDILTSMSVLNNGKIILAGYTNYLSANFQYVVMRLTSNGDLDTSFNSTGVAVTSISSVLGT